MPDLSYPAPSCPQTALRDVRLYGHLGRTFGRLHRLAVATTVEAVQALCVVLPGFERAFLGDDGRARYHVFVGRGQQRAALELAQTTDPVGVAEPIRFVPVVAGAKSAGLSMILGAALMVFAPYAAGAIFGAGGSVGLAVGVSTMGVAIGKALLLGGIIQLLSPQQQAGASTTAQNAPSYNFDGPVNTIQEGLPVPVAYGRVFVGSVVVSSGISASDLAVDATTTTVVAPVQVLPDEQPLNPLENSGGN